MPKMKSHRGAAKRFKISPRGKIRRRNAFANHLLRKKSSRHKRRLLGS
jgi:large subunit ribosomal protein L35